MFFLSVHEAVKTPLRLRAKGEMRPTVDVAERRTVIRFRTEAEALRALRERHRAVLADRVIELRLLQ